jgi:hypothetical protein
LALFTNLEVNVTAKRKEVILKQAVNSESAAAGDVWLVHVAVCSSLVTSLR